MRIYLGADHRGFRLKEKAAKWLFENGYKFVDVGAEALKPQDDYTSYSSRVASLVADNPKSRGVLFCGSGVGVDVVANKFDGVRASIGKTPEQVAAGRQDDDMNILVIAADFTKEPELDSMLKSFLETDFVGSEKHKRRLGEISKIEANN